MGLLGDLVQMNVGQVLQSSNLPKIDLTGQTVIITGANSGLGFEAAKHMLVFQLSFAPSIPSNSLTT